MESAVMSESDKGRCDTLLSSSAILRVSSNRVDGGAGGTKSVTCADLTVTKKVHNFLLTLFARSTLWRQANPSTDLCATCSEATKVRVVVLATP